MQKYRFEIFTLVSEIHENVDLVLGIKKLFELEGVIDSWDSCFSVTFGSQIYMHVDGTEHVHLTLYEVSPCKTNGILVAKFIAFS